jgi:hypothetical protein
MVDVLIACGLLLIVLIAAAFLIYYFFPAAFPAAFPAFWRHAHVPNQGVIKRDWVATGRIDFATQFTTNPGDNDQPTEFKLLVEERRIVESIAGNENLAIQWRLATLREAKSVVTQYHKYLSDNSLIKTVFDETAPPTSDDSGQSVGLSAGGRPMLDMMRREFIALVGGGGLLLATKVKRARAQQPAMPVVGFFS